ncbi:MAG: DUF4232 domain-containing protein [Rhodoglobus sp.]
MTDTRRTDRPWIPAIVMGILWLASSGINALTTWFSVPLREVWPLLFPAAVPSIVWHWPAPWNVVPVVASALCVALVYLVAARVALRGSASRGIRFAGIWFAGVVTSVIATVPWVVGLFIAHFPPGRLAMLTQDLGEWLQLAAWFGVIWGWLPALLIARRHSEEQLPRTSRTLVGLAIAALLLSTIAFAAGERAERVNNAHIQAVDNGQTVGAVPDPSAVVTPPAKIAPGKHSIDASWCTPDETNLLAGSRDAATGHRMLTVRIMNFSDHSCVLDGYPDFAFADASGSEIDVDLEPGGSFMTHDGGATPITIPAGGYAATALGWDANSTQGNLVTYAVWAAAYPGYPRGSWPITLDIIAGSTVKITAWQLSDSGAGDTDN